MSKSTITRERLQEMLEWCEVFRRHPRLDDIAEAIRIALAAMDGEPVGEVIERPCSGEMNTGMTYRLVKGLGEMESMPVGTKFYVAQPAPAIPDEMTSEKAYEIGDYHGDQVGVFVRGANWMRQHIIDSTLAAANQEVKK